MSELLWNQEVTWTSSHNSLCHYVLRAARSPSRRGFRTPWSLLVLSTAFLTAIRFGVMYVTRKGYLVGGPTSLLFLGGGIFAYGIGASSGTLMFTFVGANGYVTPNNIGLLQTSILTFIGAALTSFTATSHTGSGHKGSTVTIMLLGILVINLSLVGAFLAGAIPVFFVQAEKRYP